MISKEAVVENFTRWFRGAQSKHKQLVHPQRDWFFGLAIGLVVVVCSGYWSVHMYYKHDTIDVEPLDTAGEGLVYRGSLVNEALVEFEAREARLSELLADTVNTSLVEESVEVENTASTTPSEAEEVEAENEEGEALDEVVTEMINENSAATTSDQLADPEPETELEAGLEADLKAE